MNLHGLKDGSGPGMVAQTRRIVGVDLLENPTPTESQPGDLAVTRGHRRPFGTFWNVVPTAPSECADRCAAGGGSSRNHPKRSSAAV